jgi:hypothetical protein
MARVFAGNQIHFLQNLDRTIGDIGKVPDWGCYEIESAGHVQKRRNRITGLTGLS